MAQTRGLERFDGLDVVDGAAALGVGQHVAQRTLRNVRALRYERDLGVGG